MDLRELRDLIEWLPADSAYVHAVHGPDATWSYSDENAAALLDVTWSMAVYEWSRWTADPKDPRRGNQPKPPRDLPVLPIAIRPPKAQAAAMTRYLGAQPVKAGRYGVPPSIDDLARLL